MKNQKLKIIALIVFFLLCGLVYLYVIIPPSFHCRITEAVVFNNSNPLYSPLNEEFTVTTEEETNIFYAGPIIAGIGKGALNTDTGARVDPFILISKLDFTFEGMFYFYLGGEFHVGGKCKKLGLFN